MSERHSILIVDDEASIREFLEIMLKREGYAVEACASAEEALKTLSRANFSVVITDIAMPGMNGVELLHKVKQKNPDTAVIIITAHGSTESAVEAMKLGASDYLTKPFQIEEMKVSIATCLRTVALEKENRRLRSELGQSFSFANIIGSSVEMQAVFDLVKRVSQTKTNVIILGESGTGKELVAHSIHRNGADAAAPFVPVNCAAIPEPLFESELFGHKKGAFTGAVQDKIGIFEQANGGTLFLDEVGDMPLSVQVKLLRAIQQKSFRPVGGTQDTQVDLRIISATNKNLEESVKAGTFREDLYYRLNVIQIRMPALRERKQDIPLLAEHFLNRFNLAMGKSVKSISREAMDILLKYDFPGNVRELENVIERAVALETHPAILPESLPQKLFLSATSSIPAPSSKTAQPSTLGPLQEGPFDLEKGVEEFERQHILRALAQTGGAKKKAAALLGISFRSLRYRIEKYGIADPSPDENE